MEVVHERCCGLDVHKKTVVACVLITEAGGTLRKEVRTFSTMTADLIALGDWLSAVRIEQVAMESTGIYWRPVFTLLEDGRTVTLANPQHMRPCQGERRILRTRSGLLNCSVTGSSRPASFLPLPFVSCVN